MSSSDQTASFLLRFTQNMYKDEGGESNIQWRGKITHVQGDDQKNFSELKDAMEFIQAKLSDLTLSSLEENTSDEEKEGILNKSLDIWKRLASQYPKMVVDVIKDPKAQVVQIQEQISSKAEQITNRLDLESYTPTSKSDFKQLIDQVSKLSEAVSGLASKVESLETKIK